MNFWCVVGFIIVFNDDFFVIYCLMGSWVNEVIVILIVMFIYVNIGQYMIGISNCYCIGVNVIVDNFVDFV